MTKSFRLQLFTVSFIVFGALLVPSTRQALAASTKTITFDKLPASTVVSNQDHSKGIDFSSGIIGLNVYCYPVVTAVASLKAASGTHVASTSCANGEFPNSSMHGVLTHSAHFVKLYAGFFPNWANPPANEQTTLTAYSVAGDVVGTDVVSVPDGQGTHTLMQVQSSTANIVAFDLTGVRCLY